MNARYENNRVRQILNLAIEPLERRSMLSAVAPDESFGSHGQVITDIDQLSNSAYAVAVVGGKTLVAGSLVDANGNADFVLARYNADGTLDTTFGPNHLGYVTTDFNSAYDDAYGMAVQADGRIVLAGHTRTAGGFYDFAAARYNADGTLDTTFGAAHTGKVVVDFSADFDQATAVVVQSDGKILLTGMATVGFNANFAMVRLNANGSLDSAFGSGGKVTTELADAYAESSAVALQADGKILLAGYANSFMTGMSDAAVVRYNANGSVDSSFGSGGVRLIDFGQVDDNARALAVLADGRVLVAGYSNDTNGNADFALARLTAAGSLDTSFGGGAGMVLTSFGYLDQAYAMAVQADGRIVLVGHVMIESGLDFGFARYNADGSLDGTFGTGGRYVFDLGLDDTAAAAVALDGDVIVVAGTTFNVETSAADFALMRLAPPNTPPVADAGGPYMTSDLAQLMLSGAGSHDADGSIVSYEWDFNYDGSNFDVDANGVNVLFPHLDGPATRVVALRVTDDFGATRIVTTTVTVANVAPVANPGGPYVVNDLTRLSLSGAGSSDADGSIVSYEWDFNYNGSTFDVDASGLTVQFPMLDGPATRVVALRVTDEDGAVHIVSTTVTVTNVAPVAVASGPHVVEEGTPLVLSGAGSYDLDGHVVSYEWDFDYDGSSFDVNATGVSVGYPTANGPGSHAVALRVTDEDGATHLVVTSVQVNNAAPVAAVSGPSSLKMKALGTFSGSFVDPGVLDTHEVAWDFGDGTCVAFHSATDDGAMLVQHAYVKKGSYTVTFTVRDGDGAVSSACIVVNVGNGHSTTSTDPLSGMTTLMVSGTTAGDEIKVKKSKKGGTLEVLFNGESDGVFQADKVIIYGSKGNDVIRVGDGVTAPVEVFGEAGNDMIVGGHGDATLHGGAGNDQLFGGDGHNLLDGGDGNDHLHVGERNKNSATLMGGAGDDVLLGGRGNDLLDGGSGKDCLNGRGGADTCTGGTGKDSYTKGDKSDVLSDPDAGDLPKVKAKATKKK
jgi:uncharacterized delta-60 repeat protein